MKQANLYSLLVFFAILLSGGAAKAQFRNGTMPSVQETKRTTATVSSFQPGLNNRQVGAFGGLIKKYSMNHSLEMSMLTSGGSYAATNMYTNSSLFQFSNKLSARMDIGIAQTPFSNMPMMAGQNQPQIFLRNASIDYRPNSKLSFHVSFSQSPMSGQIFNDPMSRFQGNSGF